MSFRSEHCFADFGVHYRFAPMIGIGGRLATPPLPHHRAYGPYHGGSIGLSLGGRIELGQTERVEIAVAQRLLD